MKKNLLFLTVFLLSGLFISTTFAQSIDYLTRAYEFIGNEFGLDKKAIGDLKIRDQYRSEHNQVEHLFLVQTYNGLEVFGTSIKLAFLPDGRVLGTSHRLKTLDGIASAPGKPHFSAPQAIGIVANELGVASRAIPVITRFTDAGMAVYSKEDISLQDIPCELGYVRTSDGKYQLSWRLQIESRKAGELYQSYVNASTGKIISTDVLTLHCSFEHGYLSHDASCIDQVTTTQPLASPPVNAVGQYKVLPLNIESPAHGAFELVSGLDDPLASPFGWHDTDGVSGHDHTTTKGNNVHAFLDRDWDYTTDGDINVGDALVFDFPFNTTGEPADNQNIAVTNLFFWNNIMHDFAYKYGFTEVAGNFQAMNYTGQGGNEDFINAHAQFGDIDPTLCGLEVNGSTDCLNNADFSTPPDGFNGRMRMFTWNNNNSNKLLDVLEPFELAGKILTGVAGFGPEIDTVPVTGSVVIANDGTSSPKHACVPIIDPSMAGKIVIIERGLCDFSEKVFNVQEAGAIGAIICNFEEAVIGMGAGAFSAEVTIPSVFISKGDCARIRIAAAEGLIVSLVAPPPDGGPVRRDGSLDVSVIAHEYGHGISTRMTGGPSNNTCLSPGATSGDAEEAYGMGEGWSDFFALVNTVKPGDSGTRKRGIGTYVNKEDNDGRGIRSYPYSTDMSINPFTYDDILTQTIPHGVGSVWSSMLWDLYWAFSDAYGWDPDVNSGTGGNNMLIQLVMDGLKLQACPPGFVDARDAIIQADQINNNGVNECLIWEVFARRGLGWDSYGGDPGSRSDGIQGFETLPTCIKELKLTKTVTPEILAGDNIVVTLQAVNHTDFGLTNVFLEDAIPEGTNYIPGSGTIEPIIGNSLVWSLDEMQPGEELTITYQLQTDQEKNSVRLQYDDIEGDPYDRWDVYYEEDLTTDNFWSPQDIIVHSGTTAWTVGDVATESQHYMQNLDAYEVTGDYPVYRFWHYYNTEAGADGGFLEISTDDGDSWISLESKIFRNGYPRRLQYTTFAIPNLYAFSGLSNAELVMTPVYIDLRDYVGQEVKIRYRFGTDSNTPGDGWFVDDVEIMDAVVYNSIACMTSDQTNAVCAEDPQRGTIVDSQVVSSSDDGQDNNALSVNPNPAGDYVQVILSAIKSEDAVVSVYDLTGQRLYAAKWNLSEGINSHIVNIAGFTPGMYMVHISSGESVFTKKFVKE